MLCFVLELLILKAKYGWSDCSFNDLLRLLSWVLPQPNSVLTNTCQAKKVISPLTMGVEKSMHAPTTVSFLRWGHWINVPGVGPAGTRTMTFTVGTKPPRGKRGIGRIQKWWYKNLNPIGHSIRQQCKAEKNSCPDNVVPASDRPLETYLRKP